MATTYQRPSLATVAFLKARFDEGRDHLDMFMPLVLDVVSSSGVSSFTVADVQAALADRHGLAMPRHTLDTLLKRCVRERLVRREHGRYWTTPSPQSAPPHGYRKRSHLDIPSEKSRIAGAQMDLAAAFRGHAARRGIQVATDEQALSLVLDFLDSQQVSILLDAADTPGELSRADRVVAEFIQASLGPAASATTKNTIRDILEGLVLYRAAFLPDLAQASRRFSDLRVYLDSGLVCQSLGYEGPALSALAREMLNVLKSQGIQRLVFDKTVEEIRRILSMYERKLGTYEGRRSLRTDYQMARRFLTQRYAPSDVAQMSALLEQDLSALGIQVARLPRHVPEFTLDEEALAKRLAKKGESGDKIPYRVEHDVDCVAAVLTLRQRHRPARLEDARAIFVSSTWLVVRNVGLWFREQDEQGCPPIVHVRALSNLLWLKRPALAVDFKLNELLALCGAALRPSRRTWNCFLRHLDALAKSGSVSTDEAASVVVSDLLDRQLTEIDLTCDEDAEPDAETLDDVIQRVKDSYAEEAARRVAEAEADRDAAVAVAQEKEVAASRVAGAAAERRRQLELQVEGRIRRIAAAGSRMALGGLTVVVIGGAVALIVGHDRQAGLLGAVAGVCVGVFVCLEVLGILGHLKLLQRRLEAWLARRLHRWFAGA